MPSLRQGKGIYMYMCTTCFSVSFLKKGSKRERERERWNLTLLSKHLSLSKDIFFFLKNEKKSRRESKSSQGKGDMYIMCTSLFQRFSVSFLKKGSEREREREREMPQCFPFNIQLSIGTAISAIPYQLLITFGTLVLLLLLFLTLPTSSSLSRGEIRISYVCSS
jgi:hypothetical protein